MTLPLLIEQCRASTAFSRLWVNDYLSEDGSSEWIKGLLDIADQGTGFPVTYTRSSRFNSPNVSWNMVAKESKAEYLIKVDNDIMMPEGFIDALYDFITTTGDVFIASPYCTSKLFPSMTTPNEPMEDEHVGGLGIVPRKLLIQYGPITIDRRYFGFTAFQESLPIHLKKVWLKNMKFVELDMHPAWSREHEYMLRGWSRTLNERVSGNKWSSSLFNKKAQVQLEVAQ